MPFPPDVYLIGAQKAGTTTLAALLDRHPGISVSVPKEPHFLTQHRGRGLDWYRACFPERQDKLFVDASTSSAGAPLEDTPAARRSPLAGVPERIHSLRPDARFIYLLREPVARTYSAYWHDVRAGQERRPFREALAGDGSYVRVSDYAGQLERFLAHFPLEAFLILRFEDLRRDPAGTANACFDFLGLAPVTFGADAAAARNRSYTYNRLGRLLTAAVPGRGGLKTASRAARRVLPGRVYNAAGRLFTRGIPPMDGADRERLEAYFRPRNRAFRELTGMATGYPE
ncbi:MAG TPA: sulfotransferase domain-containing protein [Gammaproteobacteria bacterium]|nr:sulfotransferase domain-containing protein [Gammaproteobacteria bacterium]